MKFLPDNIVGAGLPAPAREETRECARSAFREAGLPPAATATTAMAALAVIAAATRLVSAGVAGFLLAGCSAAPVRMECRELQMRIDYADLSNDQLRFALQELEDCKRRLKDAQARDSAFVEGAERRFTPDSPPSGEAGE